MKLRSALLAASLPLLSACALPSFGDDPVRVRLENASTSVMDSVELVSAGEFGTLRPGEVTGYVRVDEALRHPSVTAVVDGERVHNPVPLVLETPLEPGRYTYVLTYRPRPASLDVETREDG